MSSADVKFPEIEVQLVGSDGNAFAIVGAVTSAMNRAGLPLAELNIYREQAMSSDYDNLLRVTMQTVTVL